MINDSQQINRIIVAFKIIVFFLCNKSKSMFVICNEDTIIFLCDYLIIQQNIDIIPIVIRS